MFKLAMGAFDSSCWWSFVTTARPNWPSLADNRLKLQFHVIVIWDRHVLDPTCSVFQFKKLLSAIRYPIRSPIIIMVCNVVFANNSWKLGWIWMKLGRWVWGRKRLSLARFQRNCYMSFGESAKNGSQRRCFLWRERRTTSATFLGSISAKLSTNTCPGGGSRHMVSYIPERLSLRGRISRKTVFFLFLEYPVCAQPMCHGKCSATPTLFPSPSH